MATLWTIVQVMLFIIVHTNGYCYKTFEKRSEYNFNYYDCYYCNVTQKNGEWTVEGFDISWNGYMRIIRISMQNLKFSDFTLQTVITGDIVNYFSIVELIIEDSQIDRIVNFAFPKQKSKRGYNPFDVPYRFVSFKNNNISTIEENAFNNLESVTKFSFSNNVIGNKIGTITWLSELVSVTTLDLSNNNLTSISNELFTANKNVQHLNLSNSQITHIVPNTFINLSELEVLDLSMNMLLNVNLYNLLNLKHTSYIFHNLPALHTLILFGNNISNFDNSLGFLPSLKILDLSYQNLSSISNEMFPEPSALSNLNMSNNAISKITPNAFKNLEDLIILDLSNNKLNVLNPVLLHDTQNPNTPEYIFDNLPKLQIIILFGNNILNFDNALGYLPSLQKLDLSYQNLSIISNEMFPEPSALSNLYMSNNAISKITPNAFKNLKELVILDLSNNKLNVLNPVLLHDTQNPNTPKYMFDNLLKLQTIILFGNNISNFDYVLSKHPVLTILDLSNNNLASISNRMFPEISAIKHLNMSNNQINEIYPNTFANMQSLEHLDLSHNRIKNMHIASLHGLPVLQSLNLSYNHYTVDKYLIFNTPKLSFLDISYNNFSDIDETLFKESHLTSINIDGMHVSCIRLVEIVKYFKTLNINYVAGKEQNRLHLFGMHCNHSDVIETSTNIIEPTNIPNTDIQLSNISNKLSEMLNVLKHNNDKNLNANPTPGVNNIQLSNNNILSEMLNVLKHINDKNLNANPTQAVTQVHDMQEKSDKTTHILLILLILMFGFIIVFLLYIWRTYFVNSNQYVPTENLITDFELSNR
ncbi:uncharacterized protein [Atheta coriaria]|uniref:uncharacterized protein n=1 Tax=Dalotia coriaria TaxID=877792 RepID=UPI0031F3E134